MTAPLAEFHEGGRVSWCDGEISYAGELVSIVWGPDVGIVFLDQVHGPDRAMKMAMKFMEVPLSALVKAGCRIAFRS